MQVTRIEWDVDAWEDYMYWHTQDKKTLKRINGLIKDILRHPFEGIGKPEPLKRNLQGFWSRRMMIRIESYMPLKMKKLSLSLAVIIMVTDFIGAYYRFLLFPRPS